MVNINPDAPEFIISKKIGHLFMTYIGIRLVVRGTKIIIKSGRALLLTSPMNPSPL